MLKTKTLTEILLFLSVFIVYCLCISNTINFWDSPEFIASNYTFQASHPPGAPLYTLFCSIVMLFFSAENAAVASNTISAFFGAVTVVLVFRITYRIALDLLPKETSIPTKLLGLICGILASLTLAFSTSFWTASIEAEVYTMSFAFMCGMIYTIVLWYKSTEKAKSIQLLYLFFLLLGLSVGVHLILISILIPFSVIVFYKKYKNSLKSIGIGLLIGVLGFFMFYGVLLKGLIKVASATDIYAVNSLKLPVNTGALLIFVLTIIGLIVIYLITKRKQRITFSHLSLILLLFLIGASSYSIPLLRSDVNTLVAEKVNTANRLNSYISGERFGVSNIPLIYGPTYNAQLDNDRPFFDTKPILTYDNEEEQYVEAHDGVSNEINYSFKFKTLFPRMYDAKNEGNYAAWTTIKGEAIAHKVKDEIVTVMKPTFSENLGFFYNYQIVWLNLRYLFWNFIGKQNDYHGLGYIKNGNWISGINAIDKYRVGDSSLTPDYYQSNKARDAYYFLPFLLGIIGLITLFKRRDYLLFTLLLFLTFGIGITIYVNPLPSSILTRERDYIFIGSFIIFCIWIGLSLVSILGFICKYTNKKTALVSAISVVFIASPLQLFAKGWDNHQNSNDTFAIEFGKSYLDSCPEQAILITNGDNMTFPLWYLQDVEGYRTDVRVINYDQLNIDTHIENLKLKKRRSLPITIDLDKDLYINGIEKLVPLQKETEDPINLEVLTQFLNSDKTLTNWNGRRRHYVPGHLFQMKTDSTLYSKTLLKSTYDVGLLSNLTWNFYKDFYGLTDLVIMNIIKNNLGKRPICFANNGKASHLVGLNAFMIQKGMVNMLLPIARKRQGTNPKLVDTEASYKTLVTNVNFKAFDSESVYIKDENRTYAREIIRQNYYFLAQALLEENKVEKAKAVLKTCMKLFPNEAVPYKQFAYALGRLYFRIGDKTSGNSVCQTAMENIWKELQWTTSFNPPNSIINVRHANKLLTMYQQMVAQIKPFNPEYAQQCETALKNYTTKYNVWYTNNWPY